MKSILFIAIMLSTSYSKTILVNLSEQKLYAKEKGVIFLSSRISSGRKGHETPTGTFLIKQKKALHKSTIYPKPKGGAKMPFMMRLGWTAVALHQGNVPQYPDSHGCIRLPPSKAKKLYMWADIDTKVVVYGATHSKEEMMEIKELAFQEEMNFELLEYYNKDDYIIESY